MAKSCVPDPLYDVALKSSEDLGVTRLPPPYLHCPCSTVLQASRWGENSKQVETFMGWAGQIIRQLFSVIPSNRRTFNLLDGISSPLFAFRALGQRGFRELALSKWSLQRLRQKWKVPWAVEMCCLLGLVQVCVDTQHIRAQLKCPFWSGEVLGQKKTQKNKKQKKGLSLVKSKQIVCNGEWLTGGMRLTGVSVIQPDIGQTPTEFRKTNTVFCKQGIV